MHDPLSPRLPLFYSFKKGVVLLINYLPTESNYLGSPLYLILYYIQKRVRTRKGPVPTLYTPIVLRDGFLHDNAIRVLLYFCFESGLRGRACNRIVALVPYNEIIFMNLAFSISLSR